MARKAVKSEVPVVFISSTVEDLGAHRAAARDAAISAHFLPLMVEYFSADGSQLPLPACLAKVARADVFVAIVAYRYGWVPLGQPGDEWKCITWLECEEARRRGMEVLAFVARDKWPMEQRDSFRLTEAAEAGCCTPQLTEEVTRHISRLRDFKAWLGSIGIRARFSEPGDLAWKVADALRDWKGRHHRATSAHAPSDLGGVQRYVEYLHGQTAWIDIRGLQVGTGKAHRFSIEDIYIPLTAAGAATVTGEALPLLDALQFERVAIVGDPGSGKTTFLRRCAFDLCKSALAKLTEKGSLADMGRLPVLIRIADLAQYVARRIGSASTSVPSLRSSASWLPQFLGEMSREYDWRLGEEAFRSLLQRVGCILLLDGLDEATDRQEREAMAALFENATAAYPQCQFIVTTRPQTYSGKAVLAGFQHRYVAHLDDDVIDVFLRKWSEALYPSDPAAALHHCNELRYAVRSRLEIRRVARSPVMLTALAVVHWNEKRLPEQRADLYESIIRWLSRSREQRLGRAPSERCVRVLETLALAMQTQPDGRRVQVSRRWAAEAVAAEFREFKEHERTSRAEQFLGEEEVDSGIIVSRGNEVRFWHLTFQEYLAARAVAGRPDKEIPALLLRDRRVYSPEWRETVLLLAGVLHGQGVRKVDELVRSVLDRLGPRPSLSASARCVGLLGAILRDLSPLKYHIQDPRYRAALDACNGVFEAKAASHLQFSVLLEAAEALGQAGDARLVGSNWVNYAATVAWIGAQPRDLHGRNFDPVAKMDESPVRLVELRAFQIGRYPVTVEEFARFLANGGYGDGSLWEAGGFGRWREPDQWDEQIVHPSRPVTGVSWYEAAAFCRFIGGRLPTEAEWEYAARGTEGRLYPWGEARPTRRHANFDSAVGKPTPVGLYLAGATPDGVYDMGGNVWEWVFDWFRQPPRSVGHVAGREQASMPALRCARGASWSCRAPFLRAAARFGGSPAQRDSETGFRCVRDQ